jgi:hypothetical protein
MTTRADSRSAKRIARGLVLGAVLAAAPRPSAGEEPAAPAAKWYDRLEIHGLIDTYFSANLNQAQSLPNALRLFDAQNGFQVGFAKLSASVTPAPVGFRLDVGLGNTAGVLSGVSAATASVGDTTIEQGFVSVRAPGDVILDAGRFVTSAGAEVIEAKDNWLYSRSILFNFAIPFTHVGVRATVPVKKVDGLSVIAALFNGWDNPPGKVGSKKAGALSLSYAGPSSTTIAVNTIYGYVNQDAPDARILVDVVLARAFGPLAIDLNGDWAKQGGQEYEGLSLMARYSLVDDHLRISGRGEAFRDRDGLALGVPGTDYYEATGGISVPLWKTAELRVEARWDHSTPKAFQGGTTGDQTTLQAAALAWF